MGITLEQREESSVVCLEGTIDIACAAELRTVLLDALQLGHAIRVAAGQVTGLDMTSIQLLWAAQREATARGVGFALAGQMPESASAALRDAGFDAFPTTE